MCLWGFDFYLEDVIGGIQANYMISRFSFEGKFSRGIGDKFFGSDSTSVRGLNPTSATELNAANHLSDKVKKSTYKYVMGVTYVYNTTNTKYLPVPVYVINIFGVRGGLLRTNRPADTKVKDATGHIAGYN